VNRDGRIASPEDDDTRVEKIFPAVSTWIVPRSLLSEGCSLQELEPQAVV